MKKKAFSIILILILLLCNSCGTASVDTPSAVSGQSEQIDGSLNDDTDMPDTDSSIDMNSEPVKLLSRLETAYNDLDLYAIAACFEPAAINAYFAVMKLLGVETEGLKEMMPFASKILAQSGMIDSENWGTVKLTPLDYSLQGLSGSITYQVDLNYIDGASITLEDTAAIVNVDGTWYFAALQQAKNENYEPIPVKANLTNDDVAEGLFPYSENGYTGFVNKSGRVIIEPYFQEGRNSNGNYCPVRMGGHWGFIDLFGNLVVEYGFEDVGKTVTEDYWAIKKDDKWGYLNFENGNAIPCDFSDYGYFSCGVAPVCKNKYWGVIDENGNTVVDFIYDEMTAGKVMFGKDERALSFVSGVIGVKVNGAVGVIKSTGDYLIPLSPDNGDIYLIGDDFVAVQKSSINQMVNTSENYLFRISTESKIPAPEYYTVVGAIGNTIYLHCAIGSGAPGSNAIAIDVNGNIILDTVQSIYPSLGINTGYNPRTGFGPSWFLDHETWLFHDWTLIYIHTDGSGAVIGNFVNDQGELMFPLWMTDVSFTDSYAAGYSADENITYLYNYLNGELTSYQGCYSLSGDNFLIESHITNDSSPKSIINIKNGELINARVDGQLSDSAVIVTDGIFYGLYTADGLVGEGIQYNKITYDKSSDKYFMELGAAVEQYRIGRDGTINKIE